MFEKWKALHEKRLQDDTGSPSLGRWIVFYGTILSAILAVVGIILAIYEVMFQPYILHSLTAPFHSNVGLPMIMAGVGIYTSGAISKAWQAQAEAKKMLAQQDPNSSFENSPTTQPTNISQGSSDPVNTR